MSDKADFERFKREYDGISQAEAMRLAYDWYVRSLEIAGAFNLVQQSHEGLLAVNDLCCDVIASLGASSMLSPSRLRPYVEKRVGEKAEGARIAADGIRNYAELHLKTVFPPGKPEGSMAPSTKYILSLMEQNPGLSAKELFKLAETTKIKTKDGTMTLKAFSNRMSELRNSKGAAKKPGRTKGERKP